MGGPGNVPGNVIGWYDPETGMHVHAFGGANVPTGEGGVPQEPFGFGANPYGVGSGNMPTWPGSTPFGLTSVSAPYQSPGARTPSMYSGQPGGFNIPGGIGLAGLGMGSHGEVSWDYYGRMGMLRLAQHRDPSLGFAGFGGYGRFHGRALAGVRAGFFGRGAGAAYLGGRGFGRPVAHTAINPDFPARHAYHQGGIVDYWSAMQSGGVVAPHEGVFTPQQMARMAPAGNVNNTSISVTVNHMGNTSSTSIQTQGGGLNDADARDLARSVAALVDARIARQQRSGGSLYAPRAG